MAGGLELGDIYDATIERIKAQDGDNSGPGIAALRWITHAEWLLRAVELCHALVVGLGSTDFDIGKIPCMSALVNCCQWLFIMDKEIINRGIDPLYSSGDIFFYLDRKSSILTSQITVVEHPSCMPLGMDIRKWRKYCWDGKRSQLYLTHPAVAR